MSYTPDEQNSIVTDMRNHIYDKQYKTTEDELTKDEGWIFSAKNVYKELNGVEWTGSDEDIAKEGLDIMSRFNYNLTLGTINYAAKMADADNKSKFSFYYMMDMYDKKDISKNGVFRAMREIGLDPTTYIGFGSLGAGLFGRQGAKVAAKEGFKASLKKGAQKFFTNTVAIGALEGGAYTGTMDIARQSVEIGGEEAQGNKQEFDIGRTIEETGKGALLGGAFVKGAETTGKISKNIAESILSKEQKNSISALEARNVLMKVKPNFEKKKGELITVTPVEKPTSFIPDEAIDNIPQKADDLISADIKSFNTTDTHQVNFDTIESPDDIKSVIAQMAESNAKEIDEARRGIITDEQLRGMADDLGTDPEFIMQFIQRETGQPANAETVLATRQVLEKSAIRLRQLAEKVSMGEATDTEKLAFSKQWYFHKEFNNAFMGMRAELGRGLRAFGVDLGTNEHGKIDEMLNSITNGMDISKVAKQLTMAEDMKQINGVVQAQDGWIKKGLNVGAEMFITSILSGVKTQEVNTIGNALRIGVDYLDMGVASIIGKVMPDGKEAITGKEIQAKAFGQINGFTDALSMAWRTMKTAVPYGGVDKLDTLPKSFISSEYLGLKGVAGKGIDVFGEILRAPTARVMGGTDAFFKVISERGELAAQAYRQVSNSGLQGDEALKMLSNLMENPTPEMIQQASDKAAEMTFQTALGESGRAYQKIVNKNPVLKFITPFVKTPANLMTQAFVERSPIGLLSKKYKDAIAEGGASAQMARSKMLTGSAMAATFFAMAKGGSLTGSAPKDQRIKKTMMESGWRPRSIVITEEDGTKSYVSYDRLEPFSYILGVVADMADYARMKEFDDPLKDEDAEYADLAATVTLAIAENTVDKTFMRGIGDIVEAVRNPKGRGKSYIKNFANSMIPYSGARRDMAKLQDDALKDAQELANKIKGSTPFFNKDVPNMLDNFGEDIRYDSVFNQWKPVVETKDPVKKELARLAESIKKVPFTKPNRRISDGIKLDDKQYHDYVKFIRNEAKDSMGNSFYDVIKSVMLDPEYSSDNITDYTRNEILRNLAMKWDSGFKKQWISETPDILNKIEKIKITKKGLLTSKPSIQE